MLSLKLSVRFYQKTTVSSYRNQLIALFNRPSKNVVQNLIVNVKRMTLRNLIKCGDHPISSIGKNAIKVKKDSFIAECGTNRSFIVHTEIVPDQTSLIVLEPG